MVAWYDAANNWWIARACKKDKAKATAKSSVVSVSWHPNSQIVACASTDYICRVLCANIPEVDAACDTAQFGAGWGFGDCMWEMEASRAWVNDCAWSPSGLQLAFIGHDGLLHVAAFSADGSAAPAMQTIKTTGLPAMRIAFLSESALVTGGHNLNADIFACSAETGGKWSYLVSTDTKPAAGGAAGKVGTGAAGGAGSSFAGAKAMFAAKVDKGMTASEAEAVTTALWTKHQGAIMSLQRYSAPAGATVSSFSTGGVDGRIVVWDLKKLAHIKPASLGL